MPAMKRLLQGHVQDLEGSTDSGWQFVACQALGEGRQRQTGSLHEGTVIGPVIVLQCSKILFLFVRCADEKQFW